ncbi:bifunctional diaminohydroxyphosphoribosylaminopyrimidine deaminase/5-amino-6-(5-phosphoribosylamino)uracil reductase RibD [Alteromonas halophila]|uniref:Riboflavin biosynthesis protein RibD n=1 Tax=Alteromonas halophila TaxID=516698 RepID=A0A918MYN8_9ALTE|nr:bifunctional diaminohydroxyphosphoribosylaminopyrimidine deaminase/5-amino-6-(5-phosphoribosylamino)uracil reductase RibD [Alteromonas halophila]GGW85866.1 riboflavin biosynthesis protein RibD [Alteromonas halophila]
MTRTLTSHYRWMAKAIRLARQGRNTTSPNPRVGCIIVDDNDTQIGAGYHIQAGTPHAEIHALKQAGSQARGATVYVTLEPCSHYGRTPPCANALIDAGVRCVVVAMTDPNPNVSGNGIRRLQEAGIEVVTDIMAAEAADLNPGFIKRMVTGKPRVRVKMATSLDGKIALENGVSQWITGPDARRDVQRYRAQSCAIVTGSGTVKADNPSLLVRPEEAQLSDYPLDTIRQPIRVVVDAADALGRDYQCFQDGYPTYLATITRQADSEGNAYRLELPAANGKLDLSALMSELGAMQINEVWVEAGPGLVGALFMAEEVDELICYQAGKLLGDKARSMVNFPSFSSLSSTPSLSLMDVRSVGDDIRLHYRVEKPGQHNTTEK